MEALFGHQLSKLFSGSLMERLPVSEHAQADGCLLHSHTWPWGRHSPLDCCKLRCQSERAQNLSFCEKRGKINKCSCSEDSIFMNLGKTTSASLGLLCS